MMKLLSPLIRAIFLAPLLALLPLLPIHGQIFMDNNGLSADFGDHTAFNASTWSVGGNNWTTNAAGTGPLISWNNTSGATTFRYTPASSANIRVENDFTVSGLRLDGGGGELRLGRGTPGDPNPTVAITVQNGGEVFVENGRTLAIGFTDAPVSLRGSFTLTGGGTLRFNSASGQIGEANITIEEGTINTGTNNLGSTTSFALNGGDLIIQAGPRSIGSLSGTSGDVITVQGSTPGALTITQTVDGTFAGVIGPNTNATATRSVTKAGAATLTLTGHQTYDGTTTVSNGTLTLNRQTGSIVSTSDLTMQGGRFNMDNIGASGALSQSLGTLRFDAGESTVQTTRTADQDQSLTFSLLSLGTGATGNFVNGGGTNSTTNGFNLGGRNAGFINHRLFYGGSDYVWMDGDNTYVRGINYGVDSGTTTSSGAASLTGVAHQQITGAITAQNTATFTTLKIDGNHDFTLNAGQTVTVNGILKSGNTAGGATISGGTGIQTSGNATMSIRSDASNDALAISSPILAPTNHLSKSGEGTLTLSGTNTYTGQTYVNGGTLSIGANANLGAQASGQTLNLNNGTLQATATFGLFNGSPGTNNRNVVLTNAGGFDVTSGHTLTVAGVVSGDGSLIKTNVGTLALTGTNTYTGATAVNVGTLLISGTGAINSTSGITVNTGGTLSYSSSTGLNRNITLNTGGTFIHNGSNAYTGTLTWNGGTLAGTNFSGVSLTVGANKTLSPGNSPGTMLTASQTWENGGNYNLQIFDFAQAAGTGFDTIAITGTLDLTAVTAGGYNINLWSLSAIGPDVDGNALNFNNLASGSWLIVSTTGGISGFDPSKFTIHVGANNGTAGFSNDLGGGTFSISLVDNDLFLNFTAIPEPSSVLLFGLGLAALALRKRCTMKKI